MAGSGEEADPDLFDPAPKQDLIGVPWFMRGSSAMEEWGAISIRARKKQIKALPPRKKPISPDENAVFSFYLRYAGPRTVRVVVGEGEQFIISTVYALAWDPGSCTSLLAISLFLS